MVGLDGGYVRDWSERKSNFEVIVGRSMPEDGPSHYLGFVHGFDDKPKRRLVDTLESQGMQAKQDITFLTDGVLGQFAKGVEQHDEKVGAQLTKELDRIKWKLRHGNTTGAQEVIGDFEADLFDLEVDYPNLRKFITAAREFGVYIASNVASLINYGERYRSGERISSAFVEATVNAVVSKRFAKKQQMQWNRRGAHLLLQTRTRTLDGTLRSTFERWYPGLANDNTGHTVQAEVA